LGFGAFVRLNEGLPTEYSCEFVSVGAVWK
jgi:hypothetical protein